MQHFLRVSGAVLVFLICPGFMPARTRTSPKHALPQQDQTPQSDTPSASPPAQPDSRSSASTANSSGVVKQQKDKKQKLPEAPQPNENSTGTRQTNRMMWVVPNFAAVSPGVESHPLTPKQKFWMATEDGLDYSSFVWTGVLAAQSYALNSYPELGTGATAYGRYYWRGLLDGVSNSYFSEAIVPVLTHEDPRYFTMGHGGFFRRVGYALECVVVTKSDSGGKTFNMSEVGGDFASAAVSNLYYPPQERGIVKTSENWGTQLESAALNNIAKEFWPDIRKYVFHQH